MDSRNGLQLQNGRSTHESSNRSDPSQVHLPATTQVDGIEVSHPWAGNPISASRARPALAARGLPWMPATPPGSRDVGVPGRIRGPLRAEATEPVGPSQRRRSSETAGVVAEGWERCRTEGRALRNRSPLLQPRPSSLSSPWTRVNSRIIGTRTNVASATLVTATPVLLQSIMPRTRVPVGRQAQRSAGRETHFAGLRQLGLPGGWIFGRAVFGDRTNPTAQSITRVPSGPAHPTCPSFRVYPLEERCRGDRAMAGSNG